MASRNTTKFGHGDVGLFLVMGICAWLPLALACGFMASQIFGWLPY